MLNAMIVSAKLPFNLWGEALLTTCHVHNRVLSKKIQSSPYELWNGRKPNLNYLKVWGCIAYFRVPNSKRTKLEPRAIKSVFVGYAVNSKAYRLLDLSSNTIVESRDVEFIENKFISDSQIEPKQTQQSDSLVNDFLSGNKRIEPSSLSEQRRSQRVRKEKDFGPDFISYQVNVYLVEGNREKVLSKLPFVGNVEEDPNTYSEAMASRDAAFWREAVNDEMDSILSNNTWVLVDLPPGVCETKKYLVSVFKMKDLNEADTILGIKVKRHSEGYALCQNHYIEKVLLKYKHLNVKEVNTPFDSNYKLVENTGRAIAQLEFASAIGSMMYVMHCTRPDIAFAVNRLSRYNSNLSAEHWKAIARVLGYLKKTKDLGLYYSGYPSVLEGYSDANWVTSAGDNKSTLVGYSLLVGVQYRGHLKSNCVSLIQL
uniref:Uncharacterized protein n=1 Tax=Fagus sylvatica TaxID=28930 RepID=A0A2N9HGA4_FAGSY